jgi:hypothetical protein
MAHTALLKKCLTVAGVTDQAGNILQGSLLFQSNKRLYYVAGAPTVEGRKARATYYFIDQVIKQYAGTSWLFDFEGSDIPNVAAFYNRFNPGREIYYHLTYNNLPSLIRWMK